MVSLAGASAPLIFLISKNGGHGEHPDAICQRLSERRIVHHLHHSRHQHQNGGRDRRDHHPRLHHRFRRHLHIRRQLYRPECIRQGSHFRVVGSCALVTAFGVGRPPVLAADPNPFRTAAPAETSPRSTPRNREVGGPPGTKVPRVPPTPAGLSRYHCGGAERYRLLLATAWPNATACRTLPPAEPPPAERYHRPNATTGRLRSHLPVVAAGLGRAGHHQDQEDDRRDEEADEP